MDHISLTGMGWGGVSKQPCLSFGGEEVDDRQPHDPRLGVIYRDNGKENGSYYSIIGYILGYIWGLHILNISLCMGYLRACPIIYVVHQQYNPCSKTCINLFILATTKPNIYNTLDNPFVAQDALHKTDPNCNVAVAKLILSKQTVSHNDSHDTTSNSNDTSNSDNNSDCINDLRAQDPSQEGPILKCGLNSQSQAFQA